MAERTTKDIEGNSEFDSFEVIASDYWQIVMLERGPRWQINDNFQLKGKAVRKFVEQLPIGGLSSYLWRLFAIKNLAVALDRSASVRAMVKDLEQRNGQLALNKWAQSSEKFANGVGMGWGFITAYHMLTDLGFTPRHVAHFKRLEDGPGGARGSLRLKCQRFKKLRAPSSKIGYRVVAIDSADRLSTGS